MPQKALLYRRRRATVLSVSASQGLLANDTDADGDSLTVVSASSPSQGVLAHNVNGSFVYTPTTGFAGAVPVTYVVSDGSYSTTSSVTINVASGDWRVYVPMVMRNYLPVW